MNICLIGATGRVGSVVLENALDNNHFVKALVRNPLKLSSNHSNLRIIVGDALSEVGLHEAIKGVDAVVCSLNTDGSTTLSDAMPMIIRTMLQLDVHRIISVGTAGILQARSEPHLYRFQSSESKRKSTIAAEEHLKAYLALKESPLNWTLVCPTYLLDSQRVGEYRFEKDVLPENPSSISFFDTGDFVFKQLFSDEFIGSRVGITY